MATVPAGALRQRASRVRSRSRSSSEVEPSQFSSVNVREAFTEASWPSSWAISLSGHGTAPSWRLGVYDLEVISAHIVDLETAQLLYAPVNIPRRIRSDSVASLGSSASCSSRATSVAVKAYLTGLPLDPFADPRGGGGYNTTIVNPGYQTPRYLSYCRGRRA